MERFDKHSLSDLEKLCRIRCTPEEEKELFHSIERVLEYMRLLNDVDTKNVPACNYVLKEMADHTLREDTVGELLSREQFLANAPDQIGGMIRVPPVIKGL